MLNESECVGLLPQQKNSTPRIGRRIRRDSNTDEGGCYASEIDLFCFVLVNEQKVF